MTHYTSSTRGHLPTEKDTFTPQRYCQGHVDDDDDNFDCVGDGGGGGGVARCFAAGALDFAHVEIVPFHFTFRVFSVAYVRVHYKLYVCMCIYVRTHCIYVFVIMHI